GVDQVGAARRAVERELELPPRRHRRAVDRQDAIAGAQAAAPGRRRGIDDADLRQEGRLGDADEAVAQRRSVAALAAVLDGGDEALDLALAALDAEAQLVADVALDDALDVFPVAHRLARDRQHPIAGLEAG